MQHQTNLQQPTAQQIQYAKDSIIFLQGLNRGARQAASACLWLEGGNNWIYGNSNPDTPICAEQACINQLNGIIPPLGNGSYSVMYLYHVSGQGPCPRCESQLEAMSGAHHPVRVWWGWRNQLDQQLRLMYSDFVAGNRNDVTL